MVGVEDVEAVHGMVGPGGVSADEDVVEDECNDLEESVAGGDGWRDGGLDGWRDGGIFHGTDDDRTMRMLRSNTAIRSLRKLRLPQYDMRVFRCRILPSREGPPRHKSRALGAGGCHAVGTPGTARRAAPGRAALSRAGPARAGPGPGLCGLAAARPVRHGPPHRRAGTQRKTGLSSAGRRHGDGDSDAGRDGH